MYLLKILSYIGLLVLFINTILYFVGFAGKSKAYKSLVIYLMSLFVIQTVADVYATYGMNNHFLATYLLFIPFILLSYFFYNLLRNINSKKAKIIKYVSPVVMLGLLIQYSVTPSLYYVFNSIGLLATTCIIITYSVLYLYEIISRPLPFHYVTIGILIYYLSSSLIFISVPTIASFNVEISLLIWKINAVLFTAYQLLILWEWKQAFYQKRIRQD